MLKVGVLVDLEWRPTAGGHVKCWERLAHAAAGMHEFLDLTVHFSGSVETMHELAPNVRYRIHRPVFSTARLPFLSHVPDHTDLAPFHRRLAPWLAGYDVVHTTDAFFCFARTAARVCRRRRVPLVNSIHTDTPEYARLFTTRVLEDLFGDGWLSRLLNGRLRLADRAAGRAYRLLARHQARCARVLVSRPDQFERARAVLPAERIGWLGRGLDTRAFDPARRDRAWLAETLGIPPDRCVIAFAGRLNRGKNVALLGRVVADLLRAGANVQLVCAGEGEDRDRLAGLLGKRASLPGVLPEAGLARLLASADLFAFPSEIEVSANAVMEAQASGLPTLVAERGGMARALVPGTSGLVVPAESGAAGWAAAISGLIADPPRRRAMAEAARAHALADLPSWADVLARDLLPAWRAAAASGSAADG